MEVQAAGERLMGKLDGAKILASGYASLASGRVGLNVLDGRPRSRMCWCPAPDETVSIPARR